MKRNKQTTIDLDTLIPLLIGAWRRLNKTAGPSDRLQTREFRGVVEAVKKMESGCDEKGQPLEKNYFQNREFLGAYLLYEWVVHYQQSLSLINEIPVLPRRVLDLCSGPAPFAFGALAMGASEVFALDQSPLALEMGAEIAGRSGFPLSVRPWIFPKMELPQEKPFDLIVVAHCLNELFSSDSKGWKDKQEQFLTSLFPLLAKDGHLLIVDSSSVELNRRLLMLRDDFVEKGIPIQAPCVWKGKCPALMSNSPCYAQREFEKPFLIREIQRAAGINLGSLKMSYLLVKHPEAKSPKLPEIPLYRVISPPIESHSGKRFYLCGTEGKKSLGSHLKEHPLQSKPFDYLRRGELISIQKALEKVHTIDIVEDTIIKVEAACGKPVDFEEKTSLF